MADANEHTQRFPVVLREDDDDQPDTPAGEEAASAATSNYKVCLGITDSGYFYLSGSATSPGSWDRICLFDSTSQGDGNWIINQFFFVTKARSLVTNRSPRKDWEARYIVYENGRFVSKARTGAYTHDQCS